MIASYQHSQKFVEKLLGITDQSFLDGGAVFAEPGGELHLFWGEPQFFENSGDSYPLLYINDFLLEAQKPFVRFSNYKKLSRSEIRKFAPTGFGQTIDWNEPQFTEFEEIFNKIRSDFELGLQKTVPVMFAHSEHEVPLSHLLSSAIANQENRWLYGFWFNGEGFLGATPELLFSRHAEKLHSMALAGTSMTEEHLDDAKNGREHQLVVDEIERRLKLIGEVETSQTHELVIGSIKHLRAHLNCNLNSPMRSSELIELLHPTPALGSLPQSSKRTDQQRYDSEDRKHFGAPFGFIQSPEQETFVVSIRCIDWSGQKMRLGSGCGVISESTLENEWQELQSKRRSVREIFNL